MTKCEWCHKTQPNDMFYNGKGMCISCTNIYELGKEEGRLDGIDKERQRIMVIIDERGLLDHLDFDVAEEIKQELLGEEQ